MYFSYQDTRSHLGAIYIDIDVIRRLWGIKIIIYLAKYHWGDDFSICKELLFAKSKLSLGNWNKTKEKSSNAILANSYEPVSTYIIFCVIFEVPVICFALVKGNIRCEILFLEHFLSTLFSSNGSSFTNWLVNRLYYIISFSFFVKKIVLTNWLHACKQKKIWQHCTKTHLECIKQECHLPGE